MFSVVARVSAVNVENGFVTCLLAFIAVSNVIGRFTKNGCDER